MKQSKILILGGKGKTGGKVVERLLNLGYENIRIGSRSEIPAFDWENQDTWLEVIKDADTVYITFQPDLAIPTAVETIKSFTTLANDNGVNKMVLLSGRGEKEAQLCEQAVMKIAKKWTIVRASWFNQNFSESVFLEPILAGHVALPRAEALEPFTDTNDIADVVVQAIIDDKHNGQLYELTGPRLMTIPQAITEISDACGRSIQFQPLTLEENVQLLRSYQLPEDYIWLVNYLFTEVLDGRNATVSSDIEKVLGRKATDFSEYAKVTAAAGIWNLNK
ncbi:NmrA family transcriptional regulator [Flavobacterium polysaccharolyticum]|uniref:NmrA family transcriptional regulator n=1 Tax=Flavobacterium polysaccharolyticum TaxID=3133148 RepID=A0ABU9NKH3_9FLAO